jgi:hypothetical protein
MALIYAFAAAERNPQPAFPNFGSNPEEDPLPLGIGAGLLFTERRQPLRISASK